MSKINGRLRLIYIHVLDDEWYIGAHKMHFDGLYTQLRHDIAGYIKHLFVPIN